MKVYNGENMLLGRLASRVAKDVLLGEEVQVVNCAKVIISGKKVVVFQEQRARRLRKGYPLKSAKLPRLPDRVVRRSIRGMLPWKHTRGREAFKHVMCHRAIPEELQGKELLTIEGASVKKLPTLKYTTVGDICKKLGGKE